MGRKADGAGERWGWSGAGEPGQSMLRPAGPVGAAGRLELTLTNCAKSVWKEGAEMTLPWNVLAPVARSFLLISGLRLPPCSRDSSPSLQFP